MSSDRILVSILVFTVMVGILYAGRCRRTVFGNCIGSMANHAGHGGKIENQDNGNDYDYDYASSQSQPQPQSLDYDDDNKDSGHDNNQKSTYN